MKKLIMILMASVLVSGLFSCDSEEEAGNPYLTFKSEGEFSIKVDSCPWLNADWRTGSAGEKVEYSTDAAEWTEWRGSEVQAQQSSEGSYCLYFRGKGNSMIAGGSHSCWQITAYGPVDCEGNIMTLLDYENPDNAVMADYCFAYMFIDVKSLASAPELPAKTLTSCGCYRKMFSGCTELKEAPALPALKLSDSCYNGMFEGCTGLTKAPALPAKTMASTCYCKMFSGCTGLKEAPALPAETMAASCYNGMFSGCTGLKIGTEETGGTLFLTMPACGEWDAYDMFFGTEGEITAPKAGETYYYYE